MKAVGRMFKTFYEFAHTPFTRSIPAEHLYQDNHNNDLIGRLKHTVDNQLFAALTGECGCGKTTLLRRLVSELSDTKYKLMYISDSKLTPRTFYKAVLEQLGFEAKFYRDAAMRQMHKEIETIKTVYSLVPAVVIDEAHLLNQDMLEEVRFLLNFKMDSQSPMALILSGQIELAEKLKLQTCAAIRQRIDIQCIMDRLDRAQTEEFIKSQLAYAKSSREIFSEAAIDDIFKFSGGIARMINKICTHALIYGAQNHKSIIDDRMVKLIVECEI
jgi:type II secretory pathway predicted ATPase ExeA